MKVKVMGLNPRYLLKSFFTLHVLKLDNIEELFPGSVITF